MLYVTRHPITLADAITMLKKEGCTVTAYDPTYAYAADQLARRFVLSDNPLYQCWLSFGETRIIGGRTHVMGRNVFSGDSVEGMVSLLNMISQDDEEFTDLVSIKFFRGFGPTDGCSSTN